MISFVHDVPAQRVVFAPGAVVRIADEAARLGLNRALVIATPGSGARLGGRLVEILGARAAVRPDLMRRAASSRPRRCGMETISGLDN